MTEPTYTPGAHRKVYAKGFYDGLKAAAEEMTPAKYQTALNGLTSIARKVFEAVPIQEKWTAHRIVTEMSRLSTRIDMKTAEGCLNSLKDFGLVKEPERGLFQRVVARERETISLPTDTTADPAPAPRAPVEPVLSLIQPENTPATVFGEIATTLRARAAELNRMADEIDGAALAFEERIENSEKRVAKFRELSALLKEF